jgi:hypothetical protein
MNGLAISLHQPAPLQSMADQLLDTVHDAAEGQIVSKTLLLSSLASFSKVSSLFLYIVK